MPKSKLIALAIVGVFLTLQSHAVAQRSDGGLREQDLLLRQQNSTIHQRNHSGLRSNEAQLLDRFAQTQLAEIAAARLAVQKAENPHIAQYAQQLLNDHTQSNSQLNQLASQKGTALPANLDRNSRVRLDQLAQLQGAAFDRAYLEQTIETNNSSINDLQQAARSTKDPEIQAFIAQTLPIQQQHLQLATILIDSGNDSGDSGRR
jgi:putative membrane protein